MTTSLLILAALTAIAAILAGLIGESPHYEKGRRKSAGSGGF
jgi:hypothetical protein